MKITLEIDTSTDAFQDGRFSGEPECILKGLNSKICALKKGSAAWWAATRMALTIDCARRFGPSL